MARFIGRIKGRRGEASRLGSKNSGLHAVINGWNIGVEVIAETDSEGRDFISVYLNEGSNGRNPGTLIGRFKEEVKP